MIKKFQKRFATIYDKMDELKSDIEEAIDDLDTRECELDEHMTECEDMYDSVSASQRRSAEKKYDKELEKIGEMRDELQEAFDALEEAMDAISAFEV